MRLRLLIPVLLAWTGGLNAQNAVVMSHTETFTLQSPVSGTWKVSASVLVINEKGLGQATPEIYTDSFRSISAFKAEVEDASGRKLKAGKKDLFTYSISEGLADDSYISVFEPSGRYPFTVRYEYEVGFHGGVLSFPAFAPLQEEKTAISKASCIIDLPAGTQVISYHNNAEELPVRTEKGRDIHEWRVNDFAPLVSEEMMPDTRKLVPFVCCAPVSFSYAGTKGLQDSWAQFGSWLYSLQDGADTLPADVITELQELTKDCRSDYEKLDRLYRRLREKTRYVSIQVGIGSLKPISAAVVEKTGFGDCKALSNYLMAMLKAVGVKSSYYCIDTYRADVLPGYSSASQMNHAMLAVPLPELGDTVFVECTNPVYPLGYRHSDAAGHQILMLGPDGGSLVRIGAYPDSLTRRVQATEVDLLDDGSALIHLHKHLQLDFMEPYLDFANMKQETRERMLTSGLKLHAEDFLVDYVKDNFGSYPSLGRDFCPWMRIGCSFRTNQYAHSDGERIFVPLNPLNKGLLFQKGERKNAIEIERGYCSIDSVTVKIPAGYVVESLPRPVSLDTEWAGFESSSSADGNTVTIVQTIRFKPWLAGKERYGEYRDFARAVNRCYDGTFVLRKR